MKKLKKIFEKRKFPCANINNYIILFFETHTKYYTANKNLKMINTLNTEQLE